MEDTSPLPQPFGNYEIKEQIAISQKHKVWKVINTDTKKEAKLLEIKNPMENPKSMQNFLTSTLLSFTFSNHPNILEMLSMTRSKDNDDFYLVLENSGENLQKVVQASILEDIHKDYILYQLLTGLKYIHSADVAHGDIKPENIFIDSESNVKISGFDLAKCLKSEEHSKIVPINGYGTTRWYKAPELLINTAQNPKASDVWALGCVYSEIVLKKVLFDGTSSEDQLKKIVELLGKKNQDEWGSSLTQAQKNILNSVDLSEDKKVSEKLKDMGFNENRADFLEKIFVIDPKKRIGVEEALEHPLFNEFRKKDQEIIFEGEIDLERLSLENLANKSLQTTGILTIQYLINKREAKEEDGTS